jgi:HEPN domain-containing protein
LARRNGGELRQAAGDAAEVVMMVQSDDERTTSLRLFNMAEAFRRSAMVLEDEKKNVGVGHAPDVVRFCYYHALELYLKALLRRKHSVEALRNKYGHDLGRLLEAAKALGLVAIDQDRKLLSKIDTEAMLGARYIQTGSKNWQAEKLRQTCERVGDGVGDLLHKAGVLVRR